MTSRKPSSVSPKWLWSIPTIGIIAGVIVWGVTEFADSAGLERLLLCLALSSILVAVGWLVYQAMRNETGVSEPSLMETPLRLARDPEVFEQYRELSRSLLRISWQTDPIYREVALERLKALMQEVDSVSQGEIEFRETETWRIVYEQLLRSPGLFLYRSVSWLSTDSYWQDEPGRRSLALNIELHEKEQINVERIAIVRDVDWPSDADLPAPKVRQWLHQQHISGIWIALVRESQLENEPDLLADLGIYGSRAVGFQQVDEHSRTKSFLLRFGITAVEEAEARWKRLQVYATPYGELLDHWPLDE